MSKATHVDDFIDNNIGNETYARFMLNFFRMPAILNMDFGKFLQEKKLFATFEGQRYRVTGASRMGDVWLRKDFERSDGYDERLRVMVDELSDWSPTP